MQSPANAHLYYYAQPNDGSPYAYLQRPAQNACPLNATPTPSSNVLIVDRVPTSAPTGYNGCASQQQNSTTCPPANKCTWPWVLVVVLLAVLAVGAAMLFSGRREILR